MWRMGRDVKLASEVIDLSRIREDPCPDFIVILEGSSSFYWRVELNGPTGHVFKEYKFALRLTLPYHPILLPREYADRDIFPPNVHPISKSFWLSELMHDGPSPIKDVHNALMFVMEVMANTTEGYSVYQDAAMLYYYMSHYRMIVDAKNRARTY